MSNLQERLDNLKELMQTEEFLQGKGLSNEVNIRIFCYDPSQEMMIQHFAEQIKHEKLDCHPVEYNLYEVFLSICKEKRILEKIPAMEEKKGTDFITKHLNTISSNTAFVEQMKKMGGASQNPGDVILITGVGDAFPFIRIHDLLNAMQPEFPDTPILVFYPGTYDGRDVQLFNCLKKNPYYRAFNVI